MSSENPAGTEGALSADMQTSVSTGSQNEEEVAAKAKRSGSAIKDLAKAVFGGTKSATIQKTQEFKDAAANSESMSISQDAADIQALGSLVGRLTDSFEDTMDDIGKRPYSEQQRPLIGFKKMLQEEVNVIEARFDLVRRLVKVESEVRKNRIK